MDGFWKNVFSNMLAQWMNIGIGLVISGFVVFYALVSRRAKLMKFLGLGPGDTETEVQVYFSHIRVIENGALMADNNPTTVDDGAVASAREMLELPKMERFFDTGLRLLPEFVRRGLSKNRFPFFTIRREYRVAPTTPEEFQGKILVLVGGPEFNLATDHFLKSPRACMRFRRYAAEPKLIVEVISDSSQPRIIRPQTQGMNLAIIQRHREDQRTVIYAAGNGSSGTRAAIEYLLGRWQELYRSFGERDFSVCIQCKERSADLRGYETPDVLYSVPNSPRRVTWLMKWGRTVG